MAATRAFPNMMQIPSRLSVGAWRAVRLGSLVAATGVALLLLVDEDAGLFVMWKLVIPLLPLLFLVAPGVWRNICPLAASNQTPRLLGLTRAATAPAWLKEYGFAIAVGGFFAFVSLRTLGLDDSGPLSALLLLGAMASGFAGGMFLKGKSGWCSTVCPLLPVQRVYGQTPLVLSPNTHCQPCVGCVKSCYDFNPRVAFLADLNDPDPYWRGYRRFFVAALPGIVTAFFTMPGDASVGEVYGRFGLFMGASTGLFVLLETFAKVSLHKLTTLFGALAFNLFYWYGAPRFVAAVLDRPVGDAATWTLHAAVLALTAAWVVQTFQKERRFEQQNAPAGSGTIELSKGAQLSLTGHRGLRSGAPEVTFTPEGKRVVAKAGQTVLELAEANGLKIEAGCRMGVCGADPVAIVGGMGCLSKISDDERSTLARLGLADNTRLACCAQVRGPVEVSLTPERRKRKSASQIAQAAFDRSIEHVVVIGNGIAGVTAADHVRRRHPVTAIDLVADEAHPLYNRMGIARLIYGRSAMQGLHLNPDAWYEDNAITTWLNTRAVAIDRAARKVRLGTGEELPYDRLVLATGSAATVPPIDGWGVAGTAVLRTADDALQLRAFAQRVGARRALVAGGGLLGLEAAYALTKLGLRVAVLERGDRLLRRQLDQRASALLRAYLEGLGIAIVVSAESAAVAGNGRLNQVSLRDGRAVRADLLLVAAGITPNVALAADAGLKVGRGVIVDDHLRTSDPLIYACGDVAELGGAILGLWPTAVEQAEVAAANAVGEDRAYAGSVPVTVLKVVGIELTSAGRFEPADGDEAIVFEDRQQQRYRKLVVGPDGRIAGAVLLGYSAEVSPVTTAVKRAYDVRPLLPRLRSGDWTCLADLSGEQPLVPITVS